MDVRTYGAIEKPAGEQELVLSAMAALALRGQFEGMSRIQDRNNVNKGGEAAHWERQTPGMATTIMTKEPFQWRSGKLSACRQDRSFRGGFQAAGMDISKSFCTRLERAVLDGHRALPK